MVSQALFRYDEWAQQTYYSGDRTGTGKTRNEEMGKEETEIGNGLVSH